MEEGREIKNKPFGPFVFFLLSILVGVVAGIQLL